MSFAIVALYGLFALVSSLNLLLMRRPKPRTDGDGFCILIPARNEAANLAELLPQLARQSGGAPKVYVFDDESEDGTAEVARALGANVVRPRAKLPLGWTGKNRACHELAKAAAEDSDARWYLFLDADVRPCPEFLDAMRGLAKSAGPRTGVLTGFPQILPGQGIEPLFLAWVGWILLATNPFGIVARTRLGHNRFTNGQIHAWRAEVYTRIWPNERVKSHLLEDVMMGRICAAESVPIEVANLSRWISVRMYANWRETLDGMSKNSFEITGSYWGSAILVAFMAFCGAGWLFAGNFALLALGLFLWSGAMTVLTVRTVAWPVPLLPVACWIGAYAIARSSWWKKSGRTTWKGRVY